MDNQLNQHIANLEAILKQQVSLNEQLLTLLERKRESLRNAEHRAVSELCQLENEKFQQLSELEKQRMAIVGQITLAIDPAAQAPMRLLDLAQRLPEPARGRVLVLRHQLAQRMQRTREASSITRKASEALMKHVTGLVQSISSLSTGAATYGQRGTMPRPATAIGTINVTA